MSSGMFMGKQGSSFSCYFLSGLEGASIGFYFEVAVQDVKPNQLKTKCVRWSSLQAFLM